MSRLQFGLLGHVGVWVDDRPLELGPPQQRAVLAVLLAGADAPVPANDLVERIWGDQAPATGINLVHGHVSRLRRILAPAPAVRLVRQSGGYQLRTDIDLVDMHRFRRLVTASSGAGTLDAARCLLGQALDIWRGPAFADLTGPWLEHMRMVLDRERVAAALDYHDLELRSGRHAAVLPRIQELAQTEPLDERLAAQLILASYRCGRRADALSQYAQFQRRLAEELAVAPGPALRQLHEQILNDDDRAGPPLADAPSVPVPSVPWGPTALVVLPAPAPASPLVPVPAPPAAPPPPDPPAPAAADSSVEPLTEVVTGTASYGRDAWPPMLVPAQLPHVTPDFVGRATELDRLHVGLNGEEAVAITVIVGSAGVGKTTLAVYWAHKVREQFPDGQLYVNLRGYDPTKSVMDPVEAVRGFLDALGVPASRIPASLEAQSALYRSLLDGRRVLIVLDNAHSADQVRPLLPGSPGCRVLVTSRNELAGLAAGGAQVLPVNLLTTTQARQLVTRKLGADRVAAEPEAVNRILTACAGLPLALTIVAARTATRPGYPLVAVADQLGAPRGALDELASGDEPTDLRAAISWSYRALSAPAARLFRLMGIHPGPDITGPAVASLLACSPAQARSALLALSRAHLVEERSPGRFGFHELLRAYAEEQSRATDCEGERRAALQRVCQHYLDTALAADRLLNPRRAPLAAMAPTPGVTGLRLADAEEAFAWFNAELPVLLSVVDHAPYDGLDMHMWQLIWGLETFLDRRGHWRDRRYDDAESRCAQALWRFEQTGDRASQANVHIHMTWVLERQGQHQRALEYAERGLELFESLDHRAGLGDALNAVGWCHAQLGHYQKALGLCRQALAVHEEIQQRDGAAHAWDSLGFAHHRLGDHRMAIACYRHAVELWRHLDVRHYEAETLIRLGSCQQDAGHVDSARASFERGLAILEDLGHPAAEDVQLKLQRLQTVHADTA